MRADSRSWTRAPSSTACAGSRSRRRPGATATPARASTSSRGRAPRARPRAHRDAALVHRLTGCCPRSRCTSPGTRSTTTARSARYADEQGIRIGAINPNLFGDDDVPARQPLPSRRGRARAGARALPRVHRDRRASSARRSISLWLADGTNYPGQDDLRAATRGCVDGLEQVYAALPAGMRLLVEYKFFEPALLQHRSARLGHRRAGLPPARPAGAGAGRHRPPPAGHERRADRRAAARRGAARRLPLQQPQVRRRRPDRRARSIPFELFRIMREIAHAGRRRRRRVHDRPVAQRRGKDRRDDPVGASTSRPRTRRRCSSTRRGWRQAQRDGDVLGGAPDPARGVRDRRAPAARAAPRGARASRPTRSRRSGAAATPSGSPASAASARSRARTSSVPDGRCGSRSSSPASATRCSPRPAARPSRCWSGSGTRSSFPPEQTCCGQMHLNSGYRDEADAARPPVRRDLRRATTRSSRRRRPASGPCGSSTGA